MKRTTIICPNCGQEISKSNFTKHQHRHIEHPESFCTPKYRVNHEGLNCQFCEKLCKNNNSLRNHERLCKLNPERQLTTYEKGINPFESDKRQPACFGADIKDDIHQSQCTYCLKWFTKAQIGGHTTQCRKIKGADKFVKLYPGNGNKIVLNITESWLADYRKNHPVCEICGRSVEEATRWTSKYAVKNLCVDHDHNTNQFRGLLCQQCNRQLGWFEKNKEQIINYLDK